MQAAAVLLERNIGFLSSAMFQITFSAAFLNDLGPHFKKKVQKLCPEN